jgi:hypothetical protein
MNHHKLREVAKFASGLVAADLIGILTYEFLGLPSFSLLGVTVTVSSLLPKAFFDGAVILLLVHYGWGTPMPLRTPRERTLLLITGFLLFIVALAHVTRLVFGWDIVIGGFYIPLWLSWLGVVLTLYLSYASFHFGLGKSKK